MTVNKLINQGRAVSGPFPFSADPEDSCICFYHLLILRAENFNEHSSLGTSRAVTL